MCTRACRLMGRHFTLGTEDGQEAVVWVMIPPAGVGRWRRLTFGGRNRFPVWSSDGQRIAFQSDREGDLAVFWQRADGSGPPERLTKPESGDGPRSRFGGRGMVITSAVTSLSGESSFSLATHSVREGKTTEFDSVTSGALPTAVFSRDGRWLAYSSSDSGAAGTQVYVQPFPPTGARYQVFAKTADNPHHPLWSPDDRGTFLYPARRRLRSGAGHHPANLCLRQFRADPEGVSDSRRQRPRGHSTSRRPAGLSASSPAVRQSTAAPNLPVIHVVLNWFDELNARVPAAR